LLSKDFTRFVTKLFSRNSSWKPYNYEN
jgi:hypothetical protein